MYAYRVTLYPTDGSPYSLTVAGTVASERGGVKRSTLDARERAATHGCECIYRHQGPRRTFCRPGHRAPHMGNCLCFRRVEVERILTPELIDLT